MNKELSVTFKVEPELRKQFAAVVAATHNNASQVMRDLMREYIERKESEIEYKKFMRREIDIALAAYDKNGGIPHDEVMTRLAKKREKMAE